MLQILEKLNNLSKKRIEYYEKGGDTRNFYKGSKSFFDCVEYELKESLDEDKINNSVYLEDELGDVLWCYLCLLNSLKAEGKITSTKNVFERAYTKFTGRIDKKTGKNNGEWSDVKKLQKEELKKENDLIYKK